VPDQWPTRARRSSRRGTSVPREYDRRSTELLGQPGHAPSVRSADGYVPLVPPVPRHADSRLARDELRRRLRRPNTSTQQRARLLARRENLRRQHEWGDITDDAWREAKAEIEASLAALPDDDKLVLFDQQREVLLSMAENIERATPDQLQRLLAKLVERIDVGDGQGVAGRVDAASLPVLRRDWRGRLRSTGAPGETRTPDAGLRTASLCPLSYGGASPILGLRAAPTRIVGCQPSPSMRAKAANSAMKRATSFKPHSRQESCAATRSLAWSRSTSPPIRNSQPATAISYPCLQ
jgi:hypothetical protein